MASSSRRGPTGRRCRSGPSSCGREGEEVDAEGGDVDRRVGDSCAPSATTTRPGAWARSRDSRTGLMVPSTLDMAEMPTSLTPSTSAVEVVEREPALVRRSGCSAARGRPAPRRGASTARCWRGAPSRSAARRRPARRLARPQEWATRLSASVVFLVKTTSWAGSGAPMKRPPPPGPARTGRWPPRRWRRRRGARWRAWSRSSGSWRRSRPRAAARRRPSRDRRSAGRAPCASAGGSPCAGPRRSAAPVPAWGVDRHAS